MATTFNFQRITNWSSWRLLTFQVLVCMISGHVAAAVGTIHPRQTNILIGGNANVTCTMDRSSFNGSDSTCLYFSSENNVAVPKEQIKIIDDASILWMIRNATPGIYKYTCMCHQKGVDITHIYVGSPPTNVTNFRCRGYDFAELLCNFTIPQNYIYTEYYLNFTIASENYAYGCTLEHGPGIYEKGCLITSTFYRDIYKFYDFTLKSNNSFGELTQRFRIDQYSVIVPAKPEVNIVDISTNAVKLNISDLKKMPQYQATEGLYYHVRLRPDKFDWIDTFYEYKDKSQSFEIEINGLKYAYRQYEVIVRVKTGLAAFNETMWSKPFEGKFSTKPMRPDNPPEVDVGSFYIDPSGQTVRLYWKQLPEYLENGPEFKCLVTEIRQDGHLSNLALIRIDKTSATYEYKWNSTAIYEFKIKSQNKEGQSKEASVIRVSPRPSYFKSVEKQQIRKVYHNQTYTISWRPQEPDSSDLVDFTLFWCKSKMESQNQCMGTINFMHFDKDTYNYTTESQNHTLNFAVSANYKTYSTGMIWAMCTADLSTDLTKMYPEATPLSSKSIKIQWSTECLFTGILKKYTLIYCMVENNATESSDADCKGPEERISLYNTTAREYIMKNLESFTQYKISISMSSEVKDGPISNPIFAMTTESAPLSPTNLKFYNVTSKSAVLSWSPPARNNGKLREYNVWVNNRKHTINVNGSNSDKPVVFKLEDLSSFTTYKVYVTASTVEKSLPSNDIHFKTMIGFPSSPRSVRLTKESNGLLLKWAEPELKSGRIEFYEIRINSTRNNKTEQCIISGIEGNSYNLKFPSCSDPSSAYTYDVRAMNLARCDEIDFEIKPDASNFCARHQGAPRRRRHSKINSSVDSTYQNQNGPDRFTKGSTMKLSNDPALPSILSIRSVHSDNSICKDFIFIDSPKYNGSHQYEHFPSEWGTSAYYACGEAQMSKLPFFAIFGIIGFLIVLPLVYFTNKEFKKMRSIGMELPEGLNETTPTTKGITPCEDIMQSDEPLYDKENHHLLSQIGNDSGFLNSGQCLDESSVHVCSDHHDSEKSSQSTDSVELTEVNSCYSSSPSQSPKTNIHDTVPHEETNVVQPIIQGAPIQLRPTDNGYIKPMMMTNGYVQAQAFQKPRENPPFNGYTKLDDRGKPIFPSVTATGSIGLANPKVSSNKDIAARQPMNGNICGYVTHKQLSDFGQHLQ